MADLFKRAFSLCVVQNTACMQKEFGVGVCLLNGSKLIL